MDWEIEEAYANASLDPPAIDSMNAPSERMLRPQKSILAAGPR